MHIVNASHMTVRNLPDEVAEALEKEKQRRGASLNQTVIDLLRQSLGVTGPRSNGLAKLANTWSQAEHEEFLSAIHNFEEIDRELWK
jgi:plasmid stability protein